MVLITEDQGEGTNVRENGVVGGVGLCKIEFGTNMVAMDTPVMSITAIDEDGNECEVSEEDDHGETEVDYTRNYWEDEDDIYQEFEELDFEALPDRSDTRSIASDDSFYPPDNSVASHMYRSPSPESPEPISFFKACCNNNAIIVKIMIRQGVTEEEVRETDRNRRVGGSMHLNEMFDFQVPLGLFPLLTTKQVHFHDENQEKKSHCLPLETVVCYNKGYNSYKHMVLH